MGPSSPLVIRYRNPALAMWFKFRLLGDSADHFAALHEAGEAARPLLMMCSGGRAEKDIAVNEPEKRDRGPSYDDPDTSPWPILALGVILALLCLILVARIALAVLAG
jgi:hypothetical protein